MKKAKRRGDAIVDAFLAAVDLAPREELLRVEKPKACLLSAGDWPDAFDWQIVRCEDARWLRALERRLPFPVPTTFRSLISRYTFPLFVAGPAHPPRRGPPRARYKSSGISIRDTGGREPLAFSLESGFLAVCPSGERELRPRVFRLQEFQAEGGAGSRES